MSEEDAQSARWLKVFAFTSLLGLSAIGAVNYIVNPLGYYPTQFVEPLTWSTRKEKLALMRSAPPAAAIILGSSRSMQLSPSVVAELAHGPAFNAAVDSARTEDYFAFLGYALEDCRWRPREVIIGVDVEAFHDHLEPDARTSAAPELRGRLPLALRAQSYRAIATALVSYPQLAQSAAALRLSARGRPPRPLRIDPDGLATYLNYEDARARGTFVPDIDGSIVEYGGRFEHFTALDPVRLRLFEQTLRAATSQGATVRAFISPMHPRLLEALRKNRDFDRLHGLVWEAMQNLARQIPGVHIKDFSRPESFGGSPDQFYDGAHVTPENAQKLLRALWIE